ncbi:hypothetical protein QR98_0052750 [Sarcoptes scabiei]|uniref:Uncharacterized protein n=1 Tax=Sarcoptes scabiei TaxID=52283 RepID=A0A132A744_SARSC|nr:hypothetical protein QR98_0052750 [Sarcoptes scabiei]
MGDDTNAGDDDKDGLLVRRAPERADRAEETGKEFDFVAKKTCLLFPLNCTPEAVAVAVEVKDDELVVKEHPETLAIKKVLVDEETIEVGVEEGVESPPELEAIITTGGTLDLF